VTAFLSTERLVLRPFTRTETDIGHLLALHNDPEVMRYINGGKSIGRQEVETRVIPAFLHDYPCTGTRASWGAGYATEGSTALLRKGFTELGTQRVTANTMAVNLGSRRVMEKSGLSFLRAFTGDWPEQIEGDEYGEVEYELTRAAWLASGA
jgi:RimJ/RimL family protein N-acetyltransferase